jgi:hypothetical protein
MNIVQKIRILSDICRKIDDLFILKKDDGEVIITNNDGVPVRLMLESTDGLTEGTPVNAHYASKLLTVAGITEGDTVSMGGMAYKARLSALGAGVAASKLFEMNTHPVEGETITIGDKVYRFRATELGAGAIASAILTCDGTAPSDGEIITVGDPVFGDRAYRFKTVPAQANDVAIGTASVSTLRLFKAMSGTGIEGSDYFAGTQSLDNSGKEHTSEFVITIYAGNPGFAENLKTKASTSAHYDWDGEAGFFTGGIDAQAENDVYRGGGSSACIDNFISAITTGYVEGVSGTGTTAHPDVAATKVSTQSFTVTAKEVGFAGNDIALAEDCNSDALNKWTGDAVFLSGGIDAEAPNDVYCTTAEDFIDNLILAVTAGGVEGVNYGTGTVANPLVTAVKASASTMTCTNLIIGTPGNATVIAEDGADLSWAGAAVLLSGGSNATIGYKGQKMFDATYEYLCIDDNGIYDTNWRRKANGAVY